MPQPIWIKERDQRTQEILVLLAGTPPGGVVEYAALNRLIGGNVQGNERWCLQSAVKMLRRDHRLVCEAVIDVGVKVMTSTDLFQGRRKLLKRVHRMARRNGDKLDCANLDQLPEACREALARQRQLLHFVEMETSSRAAKRVESGPADRLPQAPSAQAARGM